MKRLMVFALACLSALSACVVRRPVQVTYHSDPEGATLYEGQKRFGYTPMTLIYPAASQAFAQDRCLTLNPTQVRWASGAMSANDGVLVCPAAGWVQQYVFLRPAGTPGTDVDANFAIQLQRNGVMQQQADAQDAAAVASYLQSQKK